MTQWKTYDYDYYTDHLAEVREYWAHLREHAPVAECGSYGGFYQVARYADVDRILREPATFASRFGTALSAGPNLEPLPNPMVPIDSDPPATAKYRRLVGAALTPAAVAPREDEARRIAVELLDAVESDRFDYVARFATPYPPEVTMRAIGFEMDDLSEVRPWLTRLTGRRDGPDFDEARALADDFLERVVRRTRAAAPRDDIISMIVFGRIDDRAVTDKEAAAVLKNVLMGALGTTTKTLTEAVYALARQPELADRLRTEPALWDTAVDEILRYTSVIQGFGRTVLAPTEVAGCPMAAGDRVRPLLASANRDPAVFEDPDRLVLDRAPNRHLAFGIGAHRCIGANLAKLMIRVSLDELLQRYDRIEVDEDIPIEWYAMETASAMSNLPVKVHVRTLAGVPDETHSSRRAGRG